MKFTIVERKTKVSDDLRAYAMKKVEKLDRYFQTDATSTITFSELKGRQTVEITVNNDGMIVRAEETTTDMFASVDGALTILNARSARTRPALKSACVSARSRRWRRRTPRWMRTSLKSSVTSALRCRR